MEDDVEESLEQPTKLPALRYFGLLLLIIVTLAVLIVGTLGIALDA